MPTIDLAALGAAGEPLVADAGALELLQNEDGTDFLSGDLGGVFGVEGTTIVAFLTRMSNIVVTENTAFPYDHAVVLNTSYFTWAGEGNSLVTVTEGWYGLALNSTTLGTFYGGPSNLTWLHAIGRNGITLADTVVSERHDADGGAGAQLMSTGPWPVYLEVGDTLDVYFQNLVGGETTIFVESNPSDGPTYTTDTGPGTLSPHFIVTTMTGAVPDWTP